MKHTDHDKHGKTLPNLIGTYDGDIAYQHVANLFVPMGRTTEQKHGRSRSDDVSDSNYRLLRNPGGSFAGNGENSCAQQGYAETDGVCSYTVRFKL